MTKFLRFFNLVGLVVSVVVLFAMPFNTAFIRADLDRGAEQEIWKGENIKEGSLSSCAPAHCQRQCKRVADECGSSVTAILIILLLFCGTNFIALGVKNSAVK